MPPSFAPLGQTFADPRVHIDGLFVELFHLVDALAQGRLRGVPQSDTRQLWRCLAEFEEGRTAESGGQR